MNPEQIAREAATDYADWLCNLTTDASYILTKYQRAKLIKFILSAITKATEVFKESPENLDVLKAMYNKGVEHGFDQGFRAKSFEDRCVPVESIPQAILEKIKKAAIVIESRAAPASAAIEKKYHGIWRRVDRKSYKIADSQGRVCSKFNDPLKNNAWVYFVWENVPPASGEQQLGEDSLREKVRRLTLFGQQALDFLELIRTDILAEHKEFEAANSISGARVCLDTLLRESKTESSQPQKERTGE